MARETIVVHGATGAQGRPVVVLPGGAADDVTLRQADTILEAISRASIPPPPAPSPETATLVGRIGLQEFIASCTWC